MENGGAPLLWLAKGFSAARPIQSKPIRVLTTVFSETFINHIYLPAITGGLP
jgi:hypothetical protein